MHIDAYNTDLNFVYSDIDHRIMGCDENCGGHD